MIFKYRGKNCISCRSGLNRCLLDYDTLAQPPLLNDFFIQALKFHKFNTSQYNTKLKPLYDYIDQNWGLEKEDLSEQPFNLEECFSKIRYHINLSEKNKEFSNVLSLYDVQSILTKFLIEVLEQFHGLATGNRYMRPFGQILYQEKPTIISFNYDTFLESVIELARTSANRPEPETKDLSQIQLEGNIASSYEETYTWRNWNKALAYGIKFDKVMIHDKFSRLPMRRKFAKGSIFYARKENKLYDWTMLKLHGSLNWFYYRPTPNSNSKIYKQLTDEEEKTLILGRNDMSWSQENVVDNRIVDSVILTPDSFKSNQLKENGSIINEQILSLWGQARKALKKCNKLIVIGYSFPQTDEHVKKMFNQIPFDKFDKLIIVNPDNSAIDRTCSLCKNFSNPVVFNDLNEFTQDYSQRLPWNK